MNVLRIAAFSDGDTGGNPAGVLICKKVTHFASGRCVVKPRSAGYFVRLHDERHQ